MPLPHFALALSKVSMGAGVAIVIVSVVEGIHESNMEWKYLFVGVFIVAINAAYMRKALKHKGPDAK